MEAGFSNVFALEGGFEAWARGDHPLAWKSGDAEAQLH